MVLIGLEPQIFLFQNPQYWDYRRAPRVPAWVNVSLHLNFSMSCHLYHDLAATESHSEVHNGRVRPNNIPPPVSILPFFPMHTSLFERQNLPKSLLSFLIFPRSISKSTPQSLERFLHNLSRTLGNITPPPRILTAGSAPHHPLRTQSSFEVWDLCSSPVSVAGSGTD